MQHLRDHHLETWIERKPLVMQNKNIDGELKTVLSLQRAVKAKGNFQLIKHSLKPISPGLVLRVEVHMELVADLQMLERQKDTPLLAEQHLHMVQVLQCLSQQEWKGQEEWTTSA